jgi:RNA polymerase sigma factor (sigma-70 family)
MQDLARGQWIADHIVPWEPEVRRWLRRCACTLARDEIDDLIQEAYVRICDVDLRSIRNGRRFMYSVVRNALRDRVRRARVVHIESLAELDTLNIETPGPERLISARQEYDRLVDAVCKLPPQRRAVFSSAKLHGLRNRQIARHLGISAKTVANHLHMAMAQVTELVYGQEEMEPQTTGSYPRERAKSD